MARLAGYDVTLVDPRRAWANEARFPDLKLVEVWPDEALRGLDLDRRSADEILELLGLLVSERKTTVLMVTHDPRAAERASALLHLDKGVLVEAAEPDGAEGLSA